MNYKTFLENNLNLVGFEGWKVIIHNYKQRDGIAQIFPDNMEKILLVELYSGFFERPDPIKRNVLIHELIHGRLLVFRLEKAALDEVLEEHLANDLTRGMEYLYTNIRPQTTTSKTKKSKVKSKKRQTNSRLD